MDTPAFQQSSRPRWLAAWTISTAGLLIHTLAEAGGLVPAIPARTWSLALVLTLCAWTGWVACSLPSSEAFRLGRVAGAHLQRQRCAATCGHVCPAPGEDTDLYGAAGDRGMSE